MNTHLSGLRSDLFVLRLVDLDLCLVTLVLDFEVDLDELHALSLHLVMLVSLSRTSVGGPNGLWMFAHSERGERS